MVRARMFLRSFAVQGSWNYRTLIGNGFAFSLLPAIQAIYGNDRNARDAALQRHVHLFNSHPYLVGVALGAVSELEAEGTDPQTIERFKSAVRSSLGSLGDSLVWAGWRPACALLGLIIVFSGAPWWVAPLVFLVIYNIGHIALRFWGFRVGFRHGKGVGEILRKAHLARVQRTVTSAGAFLLGVLMPLILVNGTGQPNGLIWIAAGTLAALAGLRFGNAARTPIVAAIALMLAIGIVLGMLP